jgi:hypothetical protein
MNYQIPKLQVVEMPICPNGLAMRSVLLLQPDGVRRMDTQVVKSFLQAVNLSDVNIDIEALLGRKS